MVRNVAGQLGDIDILVLNAGILVRGDLENFDWRSMEALWRTNLGGVVHPVRALAESMKARRFGRIVILSSIAGHGTALDGNTFYATYKGRRNCADPAICHEPWTIRDHRQRCRTGFH